jgi:hypothetical protein
LLHRGTKGDLRAFKIQRTELDAVVHTYNPSYLGG